MALYSTTTLQERYHKAILDWQRRHFPELNLLQDNWDKYFKGTQPFQLVAKVGNNVSDTIEVGQYQGRPKFSRASEMRGNMFYQARNIIRAQASTELGSIQQHRMSLEQSLGDESKYCVLRVMAEELRHAYQMFWVLDDDATWRSAGHTDVAEETIDELLGMETGEHVLDAFNIRFGTFVDNAMFTMVIDLVGKHQLAMQRVFSYAPMARSMPPMFLEEGFHLGTGRRLIKEICLRGSRGEGDWSVQDVQRTLNQWLPRGVEMFGNEDAGQTNITFGFKDKSNGAALTEYLAEVQGVLDDINAALVQTRAPGLSRDEAVAAARGTIARGDPTHGLGRDDLLRLPSKRFFRRRGPEDVMLQPYDLDGELLTEGGKPVAPDVYLRYLATQLPAHYLQDADFLQYADKLRNHEPAAAWY